MQADQNGINVTKISTDTNFVSIKKEEAIKSIETEIKANTSIINNEQTESKGDVIVYITKSGKKYHNDGCSSLSNSKYEKKLSEVVDIYGPCSKCNSPTL